MTRSEVPDLEVKPPMSSGYAFDSTGIIAGHDVARPRKVFSGYSGRFGRKSKVNQEQFKAAARPSRRLPGILRSDTNAQSWAR